jgi:hypothetical protein
MPNDPQYNANHFIALYYLKGFFFHSRESFVIFYCYLLKLQIGLRAGVWQIYVYKSRVGVVHLFLSFSYSYGGNLEIFGIFIRKIFLSQRKYIIASFIIFMITI